MGLEPEDTVATTAKRNCHLRKNKERKKEEKDSCGPALLFYVQEREKERD
jgi:hypothetical protein